MKSTSSLWVGALWEAAMPVKHEMLSSNVSQTAAASSTQPIEQKSQPINPA
ncbi:hypothetical protein [Shewanella sp. MEBiC00475]|uniref:hypothetical protein n=1 Tax=Shewanella sp. MEBiC00475 TaxID=2575361 RepID=UPI001586DAB9|nr:hypothetical protein [Shewanella sp. MEBiC00475]